MNTVLHAASATALGDFVPKPTSVSLGQLEATLQVWEGKGGSVSTGVWECTPGVFGAVRDDHHEICVLLSGSVTVTPDGGEPALLSAGDLLVMPQGWSGTWEVHETVRKVYVVVDCA
ncbi:cupin domain-containing protein [Streptosporangium sp. NPDC051022]|uniref:cupin domain-containing protein n=1 Tax=Streptosporangium sp. NPDC051022 TaxID=3155752 RepID=UPI00342AA8C9